MGAKVGKYFRISRSKSKSGIISACIKKCPVHRTTSKKSLWESVTPGVSFHRIFPAREVIRMTQPAHGILKWIRQRLPAFRYTAIMSIWRGTSSTIAKGTTIFWSDMKMTLMRSMLRADFAAIWHPGSHWIQQSMSTMDMTPTSKCSIFFNLHLDGLEISINLF